MPYNEAQKKATMKYIKANCDDISLRPKLGTKDRWKKYAEELGESLSEFIVKSVEARIQDIEQDKELGLR